MRSKQKHVGSSKKTVPFYAKAMIIKMDPIRDSHVCLMVTAHFIKNNEIFRNLPLCNNNDRLI